MEKNMHSFINSYKKIIFLLLVIVTHVEGIIYICKRNTTTIDEVNTSTYIYPTTTSHMSSYSPVHPSSTRSNGTPNDITECSTCAIPQNSGEIHMPLVVALAITLLIIVCLAVYVVVRKRRKCLGGKLATRLEAVRPRRPSSPAFESSGNATNTHLSNVRLWFGKLLKKSGIPASSSSGNHKEASTLRFSNLFEELDTSFEDGCVMESKDKSRRHSLTEVDIHIDNDTDTCYEDMSGGNRQVQESEYCNVNDQEMMSCSANDKNDGVTNVQEHMYSDVNDSSNAENFMESRRPSAQTDVFIDNPVDSCYADINDDYSKESIYCDVNDLKIAPCSSKEELSSPDMPPMAVPTDSVRNITHTYYPVSTEKIHSLPLDDGISNVDDIKELHPTAYDTDDKELYALPSRRVTQISPKHISPYGVSEVCARSDELVACSDGLRESLNSPSEEQPKETHIQEKQESSNDQKIEGFTETNMTPGTNKRHDPSGDWYSDECNEHVYADINCSEDGASSLSTDKIVTGTNDEYSSPVGINGSETNVTGPQPTSTNDHDDTYLVYDHLQRDVSGRDGKSIHPGDVTRSVSSDESEITTTSSHVYGSLSAPMDISGSESNVTIPQPTDDDTSLLSEHIHCYSCVQNEKSVLSGDVTTLVSSDKPETTDSNVYGTLSRPVGIDDSDADVTLQHSATLCSIDDPSLVYDHLQRPAY